MKDLNQIKELELAVQPEATVSTDT